MKMFLVTIISLIFLVKEHSSYSPTCSKGRLTQYPIALTTNIPQGTCNFGPVYNQMPAEFKQGRIIAANQDFYNGFKTAALFQTTCNPATNVSCGLKCGECVSVTGAHGSNTYIIGDICDTSTVGGQCSGDMVQFDLNNAGVNQSPTTVLSVGWNLGMELMTYKSVPCTTTGTIGMYFPEPGSNKWSVAMVFYNYKYPIQTVEIFGNGSLNKTNVNYISLPREWTNKFSWRGTLNWVGETGDIYNGGTGFTVRLTSIFGEVFTPNITITIPTTNIVSTTFDMGVQFTSNGQSTNSTTSSACKWSGPPASIYAANITSRLYQAKNYDTCVSGSSTNCRTYFSGDYLTEWWLVYQSNIVGLNVAYTGTDCTNAPYCIQIPSVTNGGVLIIGYSAGFPTNAYNNVTFNAKLGSSSSLTTYPLQVTFDGCGNSTAITVTKTVTTFSLSISGFSCPVSISNLKFIFSTGSNILFDTISLTGFNTNQTFIDPSITGTYASSSASLKTYLELLIAIILVIFI